MFIFKSMAQVNKIRKVMRDFKAGKLKDPQGNVISDRKQAIAVAMSEAGLAKSMSKNKSFSFSASSTLVTYSLGFSRSSNMSTVFTSMSKSILIKFLILMIYLPFFVGNSIVKFTN